MAKIFKFPRATTIRLDDIDSQEGEVVLDTTKENIIYFDEEGMPTTLTQSSSFDSSKDQINSPAYDDIRNKLIENRVESELVSNPNLFLFGVDYTKDQIKSVIVDPGGTEYWTYLGGEDDLNDQYRTNYSEDPDHYGPCLYLFKYSNDQIVRVDTQNIGWEYVFGFTSTDDDQMASRVRSIEIVYLNEARTDFICFLIYKGMYDGHGTPGYESTYDDWLNSHQHWYSTYVRGHIDHVSEKIILDFMWSRPGQPVDDDDLTPSSLWSDFYDDVPDYKYDEWTGSAPGTANGQMVMTGWPKIEALASEGSPFKYYNWPQFIAKIPDMGNGFELLFQSVIGMTSSSTATTATFLWLQNGWNEGNMASGQTFNLENNYTPFISYRSWFVPENQFFPALSTGSTEDGSEIGSTSVSSNSSHSDRFSSFIYIPNGREGRKIQKLVPGDNPQLKNMYPSLGNYSHTENTLTNFESLDSSRHNIWSFLGPDASAHSTRLRLKQNIDWNDMYDTGALSGNGFMKEQNRAIGWDGNPFILANMVYDSTVGRCLAIGLTRGNVSNGSIVNGFRKDSLDGWSIRPYRGITSDQLSHPSATVNCPVDANDAYSVDDVGIFHPLQYWHDDMSINHDDIYKSWTVFDSTSTPPTNDHNWFFENTPGLPYAFNAKEFGTEDGLFLYMYRRGPTNSKRYGYKLSDTTSTSYYDPQHYYSDDKEFDSSQEHYFRWGDDLANSFNGDGLESRNERHGAGIYIGVGKHVYQRPIILDSDPGDGIIGQVVTIGNYDYVFASRLHSSGDPTKSFIIHSVDNKIPYDHMYTNQGTQGTSGYTTRIRYWGDIGESGSRYQVYQSDYTTFSWNGTTYSIIEIPSYTQHYATCWKLKMGDVTELPRTWYKPDFISHGSMQYSPLFDQQGVILFTYREAWDQLNDPVIKNHASILAQYGPASSGHSWANNPWRHWHKDKIAAVSIDKNDLDSNHVPRLTIKDTIDFFDHPRYLARGISIKNNYFTD